MDHYGTGADDGAAPYRESGEDYRASTYEGLFLHLHFAGETRAGSDMHAVSYQAIMVDGCGGVHYNRLSELGVGADCRHRQYLRPRPQFRVARNEGARVHHCQWLDSLILQLLLQCEALAATASADGHTGVEI